jgi:hypothetical protein
VRLVVFGAVISSKLASTFSTEQWTRSQFQSHHEMGNLDAKKRVIESEHSSAARR